MLLATDKKFYTTLVGVALPIAMQNLITFGINMMDTLMLGRLGDSIISAANLAGQPFFIFTILSDLRHCRAARRCWRRNILFGEKWRRIFAFTVRVKKSNLFCP